jgi:hypothetical protein
LFYEGTRNIRVDVLVGSTALFEIEQSAQRKDVPRIATKLEHLQHFYATQTAKGIDTRVRVLFGLSATDGKTITIWRQVLGAVVGMKGEIQFEIYWQYIADFLANPDWNDIASFTKLEPSIPNQPPSQKDNNPTLETKSTVLPEFVSRGRINLEEINLVMYALDSTTDSNEGIETDQRQQFFEIIETIYDGSHYRGGPVLEKAAFSVTSLTLLFRFLHLHQNRTLLEQLQASYKNVLSSQRKGISFFRVTLTRFYWDVFLRYFDFGRGGPLKVKVEVPSFEDDSSEIYTSVKIYNRYLLVDENREVAEDEPKHAEESLAWVLDALYLYSYDLGLMNPDTKTKRSEHGD